MSANTGSPPTSHDKPTAPVLPSIPLFTKLIDFAREKPPRIAVRDVHAKLEVTHPQLLTDTVSLLGRLRSELGIQKAVQPGREVYISVLAAGGYEYTIAVLAIVALGAAAVPLPSTLPPEEVGYFVRKSRSVALLASRAALRTGVRVEGMLRDEDARSAFVCLPIACSVLTPVLEVQDIESAEDSEERPAVVIFTSGSTGSPKGAVMARSFISSYALSIADHYNISHSDTLLHILPAHHATGIGIMFFPFLISGACIEFRSGSFNAAWVWERWRKGGLTFFSGVPTTYMRLMRYYQQYLKDKPEAGEYVQGARGLKACLCGTSVLPSTIADFWASVLGKEILLRYGGTEFGAVLRVRVDDEKAPEMSVGEVCPEVDLKLSEGHQGEILVKSPHLFSKYIFDEEATSQSFDQQGYYKTGDIARREGNYYWILGRESVDILNVGGHKISALDVEREVMELEYISECMVVGVEDAKVGQRVAAAIVLKDDQEEESQAFSLIDLRNDLNHRLASYKMPTILRIIEDELPKTATGKVSKHTLGQKLFPPSYRALSEVQFWECGLNYHAPRHRL